MYFKFKDIDKHFTEAEDLFVRLGNTLTKNLTKFIKDGTYIEDMDNMFRDGVISLDDETKQLVAAYEAASAAMCRLDELRCVVEKREESEKIRQLKNK